MSFNVTFLFVPVSLAPIYSNSTLSLTIYNVKSTLELACNVNATDGEEVEIKW